MAIDNDEMKRFKSDMHNRRQTELAKENLAEFKKTWKLDDQEKKSFNFVPWLLAIVVIFIISKVIHKNSSNEQSLQASSPIEQSSNIIEPIVTPATLPTPLTSVLSTNYDESKSSCPFTMIADNSNYYVKLCDAANENRTIAKFFIRAGETLKTKIPAGQYAVKYGSGSEWKGEKELFGQYSQYGKSEALAFYYDGFSSQGHTISFYKSTDGNFQTDNVDRDYILRD